MEKNKTKIEHAKNFEELLEAKYGQLGSGSRIKFEEGAHRFFISEMLKEARKRGKINSNSISR